MILLYAASSPHSSSPAVHMYCIYTLLYSGGFSFTLYSELSECRVLVQYNTLPAWLYIYTVKYCTCFTVCTITVHALPFIDTEKSVHTLPYIYTVFYCTYFFYIDNHNKCLLELFLDLLRQNVNCWSKIIGASGICLKPSTVSLLA